MQNKYRICQIIALKVYLFSTISVLGASVDSNYNCKFDFTLHNISTAQDSRTYCANIFSDKVTWYEATTFCRITFSTLTDRIDFNSSLHSELIDKDINFLWVGIRRRAHFFVVESSLELFREKGLSSPEHWGAHWSANEPQYSDCAALNVTTGSLITLDCHSRLPFVCDDKTVLPVNNKDFNCPQNWELSYPLSVSGKKCIRLYKAQSQASAEELCEENDGRLATTQEYDVLHSNGNLFPQTTEDRAYWANKEDYGSCVFKTIPAIHGIPSDVRPSNCSKPLPFICIHDLEAEEVKVWITPETVRSFPSTSTCSTNPDLLTCNVQVGNFKMSGREKHLTFQWFKDDIPINGKAYVFRMSFYGDSMRRDPTLTHIATRQGSYHCEVWIKGYSKWHSSPKVDFFYSDVATYIIDINSAPVGSLDFSQQYFANQLDSFKDSTMSPLVAKLETKHPRASWDFQSSSFSDGVSTMKILLYIYRTGADFDEEETYKEMKMLLNQYFSSNTFPLIPKAGNFSWSIDRAVPSNFTDFATYIIDINSTVLGSSSQEFKNQLDSFKDSTISPLVAKLETKYPNVQWNTSLNTSDGAPTMQILLYINRTGVHFDEEDTYQELKMLMNPYYSSNTEFGKAENFSWSINSADVCYETEAKPSSTCEDTLTWPTSKQTSNAVSHPICLNENKLLISRKCKASLMKKAVWSTFNCSTCKVQQEKLQDIDLQCSPGYTKLGSMNLCYKIYHKERNWSDAHKVCSESSSYLLHEFYSEIDLPDKFWISYKYAHGKFQSFGMRLKREYVRNIITHEENLELHCLSAVKDGYSFKLENCHEELPFVCIQNPFELVSSVKFSNTWTKLPSQKPCYYFAEDDTNSWQESKNECEQMFQDAEFLRGIRYLEPYRYLKMIMYQLFRESECQTVSWWMNLGYGNSDFGKSVEYADWNPSTNFHLQKSHETLTLFPNKEIQWSLAKASTKLRYICEIPKCDDFRPTQAYIEDRSKSDAHVSSFISSSGMSYFTEEIFSLKCIPSGWHMANSFNWYKDDILLNVSSDELTYTYRRSVRHQDTIELQGYYFCSVDQKEPRQRVFSSKVLFKAPGIHTYVLSMQSTHKSYLKDCQNFMLSEINLAAYQNSSFSPFLECFSNNLKSLDYFHFLVKNLTCNSTHTDITVHVHFIDMHVLQFGTDEVDLLKRIQNTNYLQFSEICHIDAKTISARSTVACYGEKTALKNNILTWPTTEIGEISIPNELCLTENSTLLERRCSGDFNTGATWSQIPVIECSDNLSGVSAELHQLLQSNTSDSLKTSNLLANLTSSPKELLPADVQISSEILVNLASQSSFSPQNLNPVVETVNNMIYVPQNVLEEAANSSNRIMESLEHIASVINIEDISVEAADTNIAISIHLLNSTTYSIPNCAVLTDWSRNLTTLYNVSRRDLNNNMEDSQAGIVLPSSLVEEQLKSKSDRVIYIIHQNFNYMKNIKVASAVIQASFRDAPVYDVYPPVEMFFKLNQKITENSPLKCVFWDQRLNDNYGGWSYKGCHLNKLPNGLVTCSCNHLTSFCVILELNPTPVALAHKIPLSFITFTGCSLSCFGLLMIILTFICFREWRKSVKNKALFNLSLCLIGFLILFMTGIDKTGSRPLCISIGIALHYLLLASFAWMLVSAFMMYLSLVKVLATYIPCLIQKAMAFAYGVPAVIIIAVISYNFKLYHQENYCWLSEDAFYYAIAGPILLMLITNFFLFGLILHANTCGKSTYLRCNQNMKKLTIARAKALFCISVLLGLSWIFGFLAVGKAKVVFQYLFAITTTLQGFLVFIFFVVRQRTARDLWRKRLFPSSLEKMHISHITRSSVISNNRIHNNPDINYENLCRSVIFKAHSPYSPYC